MNPITYRTCFSIFLAAVLLLVSCRQSENSGDEFVPEQYRSQIKKWQNDRATSLTADYGWLNLAGLYWLEEGRQTFGSGPSNDLVFPEKAPDQMGIFIVSDSAVVVDVNEGVSITYKGNPVNSMQLRSDARGEPTVLHHGSLRFYIIERDGGRLAVRLRDLRHPAVESFKGLEYFPTNTAWRVKATFEPYQPSKKIQIPTVYGTVRERTTPGALVFELDDAIYRLDPVVYGKDDPFFVIFGDKTNGETTYSGGRFLYVERPGPDGTTVIDFNKAYNPPCAFTDYATCPLPPSQNKLPIAVTAGEKSTTLDGH